MMSDEASSRISEIRKIVGFTARELGALGDAAWEAECVALALELDRETARQLSSHFRASGSFLHGAEVTAGPSALLSSSPDHPGNWTMPDEWMQPGIGDGVSNRRAP